MKVITLEQDFISSLLGPIRKKIQVAFRKCSLQDNLGSLALLTSEHFLCKNSLAIYVPSYDSDW
jgi:hypothetical protein